MIDCQIVGDSLGVGISYFLPQCHRYAYVGAPSSKFAIFYHQSDLTLISLGSNDASHFAALPLRQLRASLKGKVIWLLPRINPSAREGILHLAREFGDTWIDAVNYPGDRVHLSPRGYRAVAEQFLRSE